ncbi:hypothetical protein DsansV1_C35g0229361 [Dioscorea sansibarensis]
MVSIWDCFDDMVKSEFLMMFFEYYFYDSERIYFCSMFLIRKKMEKMDIGAFMRPNGIHLLSRSGMSSVWCGTSFMVP